MSKEADNLVILNQAKALEGMRQLLKSRMMKLSERQKKIDAQETMISLRDAKIAQLQHNNEHLLISLREAQSQVPESYQSELTRKCEELQKAKDTIADIQRKFRQIGIEIKITA